MKNNVILNTYYNNYYNFEIFCKKRFQISRDKEVQRCRQFRYFSYLKFRTVSTFNQLVDLAIKLQSDIWNNFQLVYLRNRDQKLLVRKLKDLKLNRVEFKDDQHSFKDWNDWAALEQEQIVFVQHPKRYAPHRESWTRSWKVPIEVGKVFSLKASIIFQL